MIELPLLESLDVQTEIEFNNVVLQNGAGQIQTIIQWQDALRTFNLSRQILYPPQRQALVDFFLSVKASGDTFLYKDKSDFQCRSLTTPYGSSTYGALYPISGNDYQICKAYSIGDITYLRPISHPVNVVVYNGGIVQTGWTLGDNGRITIPTAFDGIEFDFFVPVRFEGEDLSSTITAAYNNNSRILYSLAKLVLKEVKILFDISPVDTFTSSSTHVLTLDLLKGQYVEKVPERVTLQGSGFEVIERQESESVIELQQRKILRKPEIDYLIALWLCVKGDGGTFGFLKFNSSIITARFITKSLSYQFEAYLGENEAVFSLGELAIAETTSTVFPPPPLQVSYWFYELTGQEIAMPGGVPTFNGYYFWGDPAFNTGDQQGGIVQYLATNGDPEMGNFPYSIQFIESPPEVNVCDFRYWSLSTNNSTPFGWDDAAQLWSYFNPGKCSVSYKTKPTPSKLYRYTGYVAGGGGGFSGTGDLRIFVIGVDYAWDAVTGAVQWFTDPQAS